MRISKDKNSIEIEIDIGVSIQQLWNCLNEQRSHGTTGGLLYWHNLKVDVQIRGMVYMHIHWMMQAIDIPKRTQLPAYLIISSFDFF